MSKLKKNSTIKESDTLADSEFFDFESCPTPIYALNIALSGSLFGGITKGFGMVAAPSRNGKSIVGLLLASAYMNHYAKKDPALIFYDSEFGSPETYFESAGINPEKVFHTPLKSLEGLRIDIMNQLEGIERGDKAFVLIDSLGNLASSKEYKDAIDGKEVGDMTRAKTGKSIGRLITPHLTFKDIPVVGIQHVYTEIGPMYPKTIISGGTGWMLSSDWAWIISRSQDKDVKTGEIDGYIFTILVEKSRHVKEKSKIPLEIGYDDGVNIYSGLLDIALKLNFVKKPKDGWFQKVDMETGEMVGKNWRRAETNCKEFWDEIIKNPAFDLAIQAEYKVASGQLVKTEE